MPWIRTMVSAEAESEAFVLMKPPVIVRPRSGTPCASIHNTLPVVPIPSEAEATTTRPLHRRGGSRRWPVHDALERSFRRWRGRGRSHLRTARPPAETLEGAVHERPREAGALVDHVQLGSAVPCARRERDVTTAMAERVVDHVAQRLLEPEPICGQDEWIAFVYV